MDIFGDQVHYVCENKWSIIIPVGYGPYYVNLWRNIGVETVNMIQIQIFKILLYPSKHGCLIQDQFVDLKIDYS